MHINIFFLFFNHIDLPLKMSKEDKLLDLVRQKEMFKPEKPKHL